MKKTFATILAIATLATAATAETLGTSTFTLSGSALTNVTISNSNELLELSLTGMSGTATNLRYAASNNDLKQLITPNTNVCSGTTNSWTLNFTLTNNGTEDISISSLTLGIVGVTGANGPQTAAQGYGTGNVPEENWVNADTWNKPAQLTLASGSESSTRTFNVATRYLTVAAEGDIETNWTIAAGESLNFTLTATNHPEFTGGAFVGLKSIGFNTTATDTIPEPTTATLSLLALAGLAARRRRK